MAQVKFIETSPEKYSSLSEKPSNTLYFLTNGQLYKGDSLISNVRVILDNFPEVIDSALWGNFCISLTTGEIKYVSPDGYVNISELMTNNVILSEDNIKLLVEKIASKETITMPTLEVVDETAIWTASNVTEIEVFVPLEE
jgi:hypothetical protein